ncbi:hypothetical protein ABEB36_014392 [Hypothenemus hampei]|uniref:Uncharacterized protein n=1 Tax=Hypothenemus hampei TaxID=57062 RepID=A0ABD1E4K0_HYPHA
MMSSLKQDSPRAGPSMRGESRTPTAQEGVCPKGYGGGSKTPLENESHNTSTVTRSSSTARDQAFEDALDTEKVTHPLGKTTNSNIGMMKVNEPDKQMKSLKKRGSPRKSEHTPGGATPRGDAKESLKKLISPFETKGSKMATSANAKTGSPGQTHQYRAARQAGRRQT